MAFTAMGKPREAREQFDLINPVRRERSSAGGTRPETINAVAMAAGRHLGGRGEPLFFLPNTSRNSPLARCKTAFWLAESPRPAGRASAHG
jgi:hypothetical protein